MLFRLIKTAAVALMLINFVTALEAQSTTPDRISSLTEKSDNVGTEAGAKTGERSSDSSPQTPATSKWEFSVTPYFFLPRLDGTVGALGQTAQVNATFRDLFRNLDFALMGTLEARKGRWSVTTDAMYMSLTGKKVTSSILVSDIDVKVKEFIVTSEVGYRAVKGNRGSIDVLAGVRFWHVKNHVVFKPIILPLVDAEQSRNWADPVIGAKGVMNLSPKVFLLGKFDAGGFGVSSRFTGDAFGGLGYQLKPRVALIGGYRYLYVDYLNGGFTYRTALSGLAFGARFKF